jgi:hypothetical protein
MLTNWAGLSTHGWCAPSACTTSSAFGQSPANSAMARGGPATSTSPAISSTGAVRSASAARVACGSKAPRSALHGDGPALHAAATEEAELDALVTQVRAWTDAGIGAGEIGVSARFNKTCAKAVARLKDAGIPAATLRAADAAGEVTTVRVGTMHSFKGLEFRCVAVIGVTEDALPFPKAVTPPDVDAKQHETDLMSERCLLFVACTRARDGLYVSWSGEPSPFLVQAGV